jgi:hypothetical protein
MSDEDLKAALERLRQENAALKKGASSGIRMKVSEKGAVSIYGMGRFPVTLYKEQWLKLLDMSDDIRAFITANEGQLTKINSVTDEESVIKLVQEISEQTLAPFLCQPARPPEGAESRLVDVSPENPPSSYLIQIVCRIRRMKRYGTRR